MWSDLEVEKGSGLQQTMSIYNEKIFSRSEWLWFDYHNQSLMKERLAELKRLVEKWKQKGWSGDVWNEEIEYCKLKIKRR